MNEDGDVEKYSRTEVAREKKNTYLCVEIVMISIWYYIKKQIQ